VSTAKHGSQNVRFWSVDNFTHVAETLLGTQEWLETYPLTLLCRCGCGPCKKITADEENEPFQDLCTCNIKQRKAWLVTTATQAGSCPNSGDPLTFGDACASGFIETFALLAALKLDKTWAFQAWDLRGQKDPLFLDPTKVTVYQAVLIAIGDTTKACLDNMRGLFNHTNLTGMRTDIVFRRPLATDLLSLEKVISRIKPLSQWYIDTATLPDSDGSSGDNAAKEKAKGKASPARAAAKSAPVSAKKRAPAASQELPAPKRTAQPTPKPSPKSTSKPAAKPSPKASPKKAPVTPAEEEEEEGSIDSDGSLPAGWARAYDQEGTEYFFHTSTMQTQWDRPE